MGYWICQSLVHLADLPVPGNVLGIAVLFILLCTGVVKEKWLSAGGGFLLKHLVFFFVPIAVGLMDWWDVFAEYGWVLLVTLLISSLLPLITVGGLAALLRKGKEPCSR